MAETRTSRLAPTKPSSALLVAFLGLVLLAVAHTPLAAAVTGTVEGVVLDVEENRPLAGVRLKLTGGGLPGHRETVSDAGGAFHFPHLPPGIYVLLATQPGYTTLEQTEIQIEIEHTVTLTLEMITAFNEDDEEVMITGAAPVLDGTSAAIGGRYDLDHFDRVPADRFLRDVPARTAGVVPRAAWTDPVSIAGGTAEDNVLRLDGLDVTRRVSGGSGLSLPWDQVQQMEVSSGGRPAGREGSFGGIVQLLTRRGGPEHRGRLSVYGQATDTAADPPPTVTVGQERSPDAWDAGFSLGGPAVRDRLWYFAGLRRATTERHIDNRQGVGFDEERVTRAWTARLTAQPSSRLLLSLSAASDPTDLENEPLRDAAGRLGHDGELGGEAWTLGLQGTLGRRLFLDFRGGRFEETFEATPLGADFEAPFYEDLTFLAVHARAAGCGREEGLGSGVAFTPGCVGGSVVRDDGRATREEAAATFTWASGRGTPEDESGIWHRLRHTVRWGFDARQGELHDDTRSPGATSGPFVDDRGTVVDPGGLSGQHWQITDEVARLFEIEGVDRREHEEIALFVEDQVRFSDHAVLRVGLRAEQMDAELRLDDPGAPRLSFDFADTLAPRLSLVWDLEGNGRSRFFAQYGRYVDSRPPAVEGLPFAARRWNVYTFALPPDGSLPTAHNPGELLERRRLARTLLVAPDLEAPSVTETRIGFSLEPLPDVTLGVSAVVRDVEEIVEDVSLDGGETYVLLNPSGALTADPVTGEPLDSVAFFPRPSRDYQAFEVRIDKGFGNAWQLHGSYTFAESEGNYGGPVPPTDGSALTPSFDTRFDLPGALPRGDGSLVGDRRHQWRFYGSWQWASKITTGLYGRYLSGAPTARLTADSGLGRRTRFLDAADAGGRLPELWSVDFHAEYPLEIAGRTVELVGDVFNLTNRDAPVRVVEEWSFLPEDSALVDETVQTQSAFGTGLEHQQPRTVRLGVRVRW